MATDLASVVDYLNEYLDIDGVSDAALNGLQLEAGGEVTRVAIAVDAAAATIDSAVERDCQLLVAHHGLFWGGARPLTGLHGERVRRCYDAGLSVYGAHLPLDRHPVVGNNALLARALGAAPSGGFGAFEGVEIGTLAQLPQPVSLAEVAGRLAGAGCDEQLMWSFGADPVQLLAVVTGSGCSLIDDAIAAGADCFITGEPRQAAYHQAREASLNCLFAGHYATETFGVRAVGELLRERFGIEPVWIDHPTGV